MDTYRHSVTLDRQKCIGCTTCVRHCPTEAIRVVDGHAVINDARCIDCGECIRMCSHGAKLPVYDKLSAMDRFKWKIAVPAPSLYGQFNGLDDIDYVLNGLKKIGFDDVFEVATAAELVSAYTRMYLKTDGVKKPAISSACPVVVRLIGLRFPSLKDNIVQLLPPVEVAASMAREKAKKEHPELKDEDIGICFISPCPAKYSFVKNDFGQYKSKVDVVIAISELYFLLLNVMNRRDSELEILSKTGKIGISWATTGGEATAIFNDGYLAADGINNVIDVLDELENGNIPQLEFIELNACPGGCVGGVMTVENPYVAKARLRNLRRYMAVSQNVFDGEYIPGDSFFDGLPEYQPINRLASTVSESMRLMSEVQKIRDGLPGLDCGACGAPTCRAFAEDIVRGKREDDICPILAAGKYADMRKVSDGGKEK